MKDEAASLLTLLQAYLATTRIPEDGRLRPETDRTEALGMSRSELRNDLAVMEAEGQLWEHVDRSPWSLAAIGNAAALATVASSIDITQARLLIEPELAALAAIHGTEAHLVVLRDAMQASCRSGQTWRDYEVQDERLHREIAVAAGNPVLLSLYDHLATARCVLAWSKARDRIEGPTLAHPSFAEHERIVAAIAARNKRTSRAAMKRHIESVHQGSAE